MGGQVVEREDKMPGEAANKQKQTDVGNQQEERRHDERRQTEQNPQEERRRDERRQGPGNAKTTMRAEEQSEYGQEPQQTEMAGRKRSERRPVRPKREKAERQTNRLAVSRAAVTVAASRLDQRSVTSRGSENAPRRISARATTPHSAKAEEAPEERSTAHNGTWARPDKT